MSARSEPTPEAVACICGLPGNLTCPATDHGVGNAATYASQWPPCQHKRTRQAWPETVAYIACCDCGAVRMADTGTDPEDDYYAARDAEETAARRAADYTPCDKARAHVNHAHTRGDCGWLS